MKWFKVVLMCVFLTIPVQFKADIADLVIFENILKLNAIPRIVTVTTYTVNRKAYTASGFVVTPDNPAAERIIAVSRDLKKRFEYGERVFVTGIGEYSGVYIIRDLMGKKWKNRIDILIDPEDTHTKLFNARLYKMNNEESEK